MSRRSYRNFSSGEYPQEHTHKQVTRTYTNNRDYTDRTDREDSCFCDQGRDHTSMTTIRPGD
jgi:hypothetical protein